MEDYLAVGLIVIWAVYYVWKTFRPKKGGGCAGGCGGGCGGSKKPQSLSELQSQPDPGAGDAEWNWKQ